MFAHPQPHGHPLPRGVMSLSVITLRRRRRSCLGCSSTTTSPDDVLRLYRYSSAMCGDQEPSASHSGGSTDTDYSATWRCCRTLWHLAVRWPVPELCALPHRTDRTRTIGAPPTPPPPIQLRPIGLDRSRGDQNHGYLGWAGLKYVA